MKMMKNYKSLAVAVVLVLGVVTATVFSTQLVSAAPVDVLKECNSGSQVCKGTNGSTLYTIVRNVVNLLIFIIGIIAVIMIVIGGFRYTTSGGDGSQTKSARDTIIYAVVGLVIAIMAYSIVNFVLREIK